MQTVNGKLIITDRQELDTAKEQIDLIDRRCDRIENYLATWEQQKAEILQTTRSIKNSSDRIATLEQKNQQLSGSSNRRTIPQKLLSLLTIGTLCFGSAWMGTTLSNRANPASQKVKKSTIERPKSIANKTINRLLSTRDRQRN